VTVGFPPVLADPQVVSSFIVAGFALVGVLAGLIVPRLHRNTRELKAQAGTLESVREQVQNSHGTNLRDDLDFIREVLLETRTDVAWIRREQLDQARRLVLLEGAPS
jgi:uncharacterized membrane protein